MHRPQRFKEVLGQTAPVRALAAAAERGEIAAAYIFSGTRGVGKTTVARIFAKALNCERPAGGDCCGECTACREIAEGRALDVLELDAATHTGIDDIRELREAAQYPPARDHRRVFILDEAHQLSQSAWNGLLKILEEPPPWCVFLFCTTEPHKIPATIESRALHFSFRSLSSAQIRDHLARVAEKEGVVIEPEALELLVRAADGSVRDGLSALDQVRALVDGSIGPATVREALGLVSGEAVSRFVGALGRGDAKTALEVVASLDAEGEDLRSFAAEVLEQVRRLALVRAAGAQAVPDGAALVELSRQFAPEQLVWLGRVLDETEARLRQGGPSRTLLDLAAMRMTSMAGLTSLADLAARLGAGPRPGSAPSGGAPSGGGPGPARRPAPTAPPVSRSPSAPAPAPTRKSGASDLKDDGAEGAAVDGALAPEGAGLLAQLVQTVQQIRPPVAAYLRNVQGAELSPSGALRLTLPRAKSIYEARLSQPAAQEALLSAVQRATGRPATSLEFVAGGGGAPPARATRQEVLDRARQTPVVQALLERFGAVMVNGQALEHEDPQES